MSMYEYETGRRGILLAGGSGTRLYPATGVISKQLLPVYDKPMVYYPLTSLMLAGIREVLIISTPRDLPQFQSMLGDGGQWGLQLEYACQPEPEGIAQAFQIGRDFIGDRSSALVLGDNIFHGDGLPVHLRAANNRQGRATVFAYPVSDPERYGVVSFDEDGRATSIAEKPEVPASRYAVTGLYFYPPGVSSMADRLAPSARGELEITDLNELYLQSGQLDVEVLSRGMVWLDTGTHDSLHEASAYIQTIEKRMGLKVACPEEVALRMGYIDASQLERLIEPHRKTSYGRFLKTILEEHVHAMR